jgi:hypothetical protein
LAIAINARNARRPRVCAFLIVAAKHMRNIRGFMSALADSPRFLPVYSDDARRMQSNGCAGSACDGEFQDALVFSHGEPTYPLEQCAFPFSNP